MATSSSEVPTFSGASPAAPPSGRVALPVLGPPPPRPVVPECYGDVCITCSDEAVPVTILELLDDELARVDTGQSVEVVSVALVDAGVGDVILVHAKEAIAVVRD